MNNENQSVVGACETHHETEFERMFIRNCENLLDVPSYAVKQGNCIIALLDEYDGPLSCDLYDGSGTLCELGFYHDNYTPIVDGYIAEKEYEIRDYLLFYTDKVGAIVETDKDLLVYSKTCWENKCIPMGGRCF